MSVFQQFRSTFGRRNQAERASDLLEGCILSGTLQGPTFQQVVEQHLKTDAKNVSATCPRAFPYESSWCGTCTCVPGREVSG